MEEKKRQKLIWRFFAAEKDILAEHGEELPVRKRQEPLA